MILVVNDDPNVTYTLCELLKLDGHACDAATDAPEALAKIESARKHEPLLALIDLRMPTMSGLDLLKKIRATEGIAQTPAVMLSATDEDSVRREARDLGVWDYLLLGSDMKAMLDRIGALYERARREAPNG